MPSRRSVLLAGAGLSGAPAAAQGLSPALDATARGLAPDSEADQSRLLARLLRDASRSNQPVFLGPGAYRVAALDLPPRVRLVGVPGATRLVFAGGTHLLRGEDCEHVSLSGLTLDGANHPLDADTRALLDLRRIAHLHLDACTVLDSAAHAVALERVAGRVERCRFASAAESGLYAVDATGLSIEANHVHDCGNGGLLVHRWEPGEDNTLVHANRVERIAARNGGTGEFGNGINVFQANNAIVSANHVSDCAFSAIRSNGGGNVQITTNTCLRSGEVAIYSEFRFEGAVISNNVVDGAATGISVANFNEGGRLAVVSGNLVRNLRATGPYPPDPPGFGEGVYVEADAAVTGNVVEGAPLYGLSLGWGPYLRDVVATGNVLRRCRFGIAVSVVEGTGSALVADNVVTGSTEAALVGHRWADIATRDLARDANGTTLTVARNHVG